MRLAWAALLLGAPALAQAGDSPASWLELQSALKGTLVLTRAREVSPLAPERVTSASLWRLRLEPRATPADWLSVVAAWEQRLRLASSQGALTSPGLPTADARAPFRLVALEGSLGGGGSWSWWHELDRLSVAVHLPRVELTVGRQALGWGRGMMFGAVDLFAPFTPLEVDREWRRGVDAVRAEVRLTPRTSVEAVGVVADALERSAAVGRLRGFVGPVDAELVGGWRAGDGVAGLAASAAVLDAEVHGELAAFFLEEPWEAGGAVGGGRVVLKAVAGASYQLDVGDGVRVAAEYHYNGFGVRFPVSALELAADDALRTRLLRGDMQSLGRHLAAAVVGTSFGLSLGVSLQVLVDPSDGSGVVAPSVSWDVSDNVSLVGAGYVGWGALPRGLELPTQLGATPITVLVQLRVYDLRTLERPGRKPQ